MESFEIYYSNLNKETQKDLLEFYNMKDESEGNFELTPLCIIDKSNEGE